MIIWINGAFGAGKTTVSKLLHKRLPDAYIFDPEDIGYILQKTFPPVRKMDYQDVAMWRSLVIQFISEAAVQFPAPLIIPMTLVVPAYLEEIFSEVAKTEATLQHFFLHTEKQVLERRIKNQVIIENNPEKDEEVRQWRLDQSERSVLAEAYMPENTVFLDTNVNAPEDLVNQILAYLEKI